MLERTASRVLLLLLLLMMGCKHGPDAVLGSVAPQASAIGDAEPLGPEGQASLHTILETGNLPDLRWPDFSDYREDVAKFYVDNHENVASSGAVSDEMLQEVREGKLSVRQRPGPKNSLGLIKFNFPNEYDVYMHDTPATALFSKSRRDFSHGIWKPRTLST